MAVISFGTGGWRDRYDAGFNAEGVARVATALARAWSAQLPGAMILVGYDTRYEAKLHAQTVAQILSGAGLSVLVSSEPCPTPALGWCVSQSDACAGGVMVTASDAPCDYNGIIVRGSDGGTASLSFVEAVNDLMPSEPSAARGPYKSASFCEPYADHLLQLIDARAIKRARLKVVVDNLYGSAGSTLSLLLRRLGCQVSELHPCTGDLEISDVHPQVIEPWVDDCEAAVVEQQADLGIALDGDGGRAAVIDGRGTLITCNRLMPVLIAHLAQKTGAAGEVVTTLAASSRGGAMAEGLGLDHVRVPVGFRRIHDEVTSTRVLAAFEEYGGVCVPSHLCERDGLLATLLYIEKMAQDGQSASAVAEEAEKITGKMRYARKDVRLDSGHIQRLRNVLPGVNPDQFAAGHPREVNHADGLRMELESGAWLMLRPSRTEPLIRMYAEGRDHEECDHMMQTATKILESVTAS